MKTFNKILGFFSIVAVLGSCSKEITSGNDSNTVIDSNSRYIQFAPGVSTRGTLVTTPYLQDNFAVLGYQYSRNWQTTSKMAKPDVFASTPQIVSYKNGIYEYSPLRVWTGNYYSFFAYYPSQNNNIALFDEKYEGTPYISYTHPKSTDPREMVDVMTASYIDTHVDASPEVRMRMEHRMSAIDIMARNYYQYTDKSDILHLVTIEIIDLTLSLETYTGAQIYLDHDFKGANGKSTVPFYDAESGEVFTQTVDYKFVSSESTLDWAPASLNISSNHSEDTNLRPITQVGTNDANAAKGTTVLLIPHSNPDDILKGSLKMTYKKKYSYTDENGNDSDIYITDEKSNTNVFSINEDLSKHKCTLKEGIRYYIEITFTSDAVSVNIVKSDDWDELEEDVKLEFE